VEAAAAPTTLADISLTLPRGSLTVVCGPVGAGKSSLLMALLGELPASSGGVGVAGRVSFAAQQPYVLTGTVRENVLCGRPWDPARYAAVLEACCLRPDLRAWPNGDATVIGERGVNLSGGQRARVGLARAVYDGGADVFLCDDVLAAVDARVRALWLVLQTERAARMVGRERERLAELVQEAHAPLALSLVETPEAEASLRPCPSQPSRPFLALSQPATDK
jgi:ABC-type transport system involved in cytochrome bd biosynthesis fused ATPase/permease subunit